jgi:hypothetical protein
MYLRAILAVLAIALIVTFAGCGTDYTLASIEVTPGVQVLNATGETSQFKAIGTYAKAGHSTTRDITNQVQWSSSDVSVATIDSAGLATAGIVFGQTTIFATSKSGATIIGTSDLITAGGAVGQLTTLAVYTVGLGTGTVTSDPPVGINCTSTSGAGCTGNFQLNTIVTLIAAPTSGSTFGGWSSNCTPSDQPTCTITMSSNDAVGVIFNH